MTHATARKQGLDPVFPENTTKGQRVFYDTKEGKYYDAFTDLYIELDAFKSYQGGAL